MQDYDNAILNGIVKIASKMGISTIQSYQSSQIFEAVGISKEVIDKYFTGTVSRVGGISMADIQADVEALHNTAFDPLGLDINMELADSGSHKFRSGTSFSAQRSSSTGSPGFFLLFMVSPPCVHPSPALQ